MHASAAEAVLAMSGRLAAGDPAARFGGAAIDSRTIRGGELFFAFRGERVDGRAFVADAFARGAAGAVVEAAAGEPVQPPEGSHGFVIEVANVGDALVELARSLRERAPEQLAGITGSAGKTTTKELLAAMLARRFRVGRTAGNFNNRIGLPVSLLNVPDETEWMVAEMGMSSAGELRELSLLARPDLAVFTVVRPVHLEFFDSVRAIAEAKAELLAGLANDGWIVANACDPEIVRIVRRHRAERGDRGGRIIWYALGEPAAGFNDGSEAADRPDLRALDIVALPDGRGSRFVLEVEGQRFAVRLALHGAYNVENFLAAAAAAWSIGVPVEEIVEVAAEMPNAPGRGEVHRLKLPGGGSAWLIDDSYNSNPDAVGKALAGAAGLPTNGSPGRRVAILGDMLELGPQAAAFHREAGRQAATLGFSPVVGVGELARELVAGAAAGGAEALHLAEAAAAADWAAEHLAAGDVVLVKGSRGVRLDRVVGRMLKPVDGEERA